MLRLDLAPFIPSGEEMKEEDFFSLDTIFNIFFIELVNPYIGIISTVYMNFEHKGFKIEITIVY